MPREGIASMFEELFNKEAGDDEGEVEVEEDLTQLSGKEKGKRMKEEALKKKGSYQDPEATGSYASKRGRMIGMAEKLGLADPKLKDKPYKKSGYDWKKWTRKADGGRIGFAIGGSYNLNPQEQNIYDAWINAGHSEEDVLAYLKSRNIADVEDLGITSIVNTAPVIGGDGGDGGGAGIISTQPSYKYTSQYDQGNMVGPRTKEDFESWLTDIGEGTIDEEDITWGTQWNELKHQLGRIPTPFNLVKKGITGARNWWDEQQGKNAAIREQQIQKEIEAAKKLRLAQEAAALASAQAPSGGQWVGGAPAYTYQGQGGGEYIDRHTGQRDYHDPYDPGGGEKQGGLIGYKDGGLATMFQRR